MGKHVKSLGNVKSLGKGIVDPGHVYDFATGKKKINGLGKAFERPDVEIPAAEATPAASTTMTPAIAKSIAQDTEAAQAQQLAARQRMRGISSTYLRGATTTAGGKTRLGQ